MSSQSPLLTVVCLLCPLHYLHYFQVCYNVIHPSKTRSSSPLSCKQCLFHHLPWHRSHSHSLYMSQPSYPSEADCWVSEQIIYTVWGCQSHAQPPTWRTGVSLSSGSSPLTCLAWEAIPVACAITSIALGFI